MLRRRTLVIGLAGVISACTGPGAAPSREAARGGASPALATPPATPEATPGPTPQPTPLTDTPAAATPVPTAAPEPQVALDVRLFNAAAEVQLDGRTIEPGRIMVAPRPHQVAALVDGAVAAIVDASPDGGTVDLVVRPPLASLAIMIENQADARPQTGLTNADVVYEALAEGGITRFIAVFLSGDAPVVGPVRSLRHYFAFLAADYGADVVHIGASPEGFAWRDAMNLGHLDESAGDPGVWRVRSRRPPHNAYTDTTADRAYLIDEGRQQNRSWGPLLMSGRAPRGEEDAENIILGFSPWPYRVSYQWDAETGRYSRFMDDEPHVDAANGEQIAPATVIVQFTEVDRIPNDPKLRLDMNLVGGSGQLMVFSSGARREGTWSKSAPRSPTRWLDAQGERFIIPPGPVWVEVVPIDSPVSWG